MATPPTYGSDGGLPSTSRWVVFVQRLTVFSWEVGMPRFKRSVRILVSSCWEVCSDSERQNQHSTNAHFSREKPNTRTPPDLRSSVTIQTPVTKACYDEGRLGLNHTFEFSPQLLCSFKQVFVRFDGHNNAVSLFCQFCHFYLLPYVWKANYETFLSIASLFIRWIRKGHENISSKTSRVWSLLCTSPCPCEGKIRTLISVEAA